MRSAKFIEGSGRRRLTCGISAARWRDGYMDIGLGVDLFREPADVECGLRPRWRLNVLILPFAVWFEFGNAIDVAADA